MYDGLGFMLDQNTFLLLIIVYKFFCFQNLEYLKFILKIFLFCFLKLWAFKFPKCLDIEVSAIKVQLSLPTL